MSLRIYVRSWEAMYLFAYVDRKISFSTLWPNSRSYRYIHPGSTSQNRRALRKTIWTHESRTQRKSYESKGIATYKICWKIHPLQCRDVKCRHRETRKYQSWLTCNCHIFDRKTQALYSGLLQDSSSWSYHRRHRQFANCRSTTYSRSPILSLNLITPKCSQYSILIHFYLRLLFQYFWVKKLYIILLSRILIMQQHFQKCWLK